MVNVGLNNIINTVTKKKWPIVKVDFYVHGVNIKAQGTWCKTNSNLAVKTCTLWPGL